MGEPLRWHSGPPIRPLEPMEKYVHLIRAPDDPERLTRVARQKMHGAGAAAQAWKGALKPANKGVWREKILAHLADGVARTFNRMVLEISDFEYTADVAFGKAPDLALWELVDEGAVEFTCEAPMLFRAIAAIVGGE